MPLAGGAGALAVLVLFLLTVSTAAAASPYASSSYASSNGGRVPVALGSAPEHPYSVQLHIHASMSENNGSMEWHAQKAHDLGVDVIWWTDHGWRVTQTGYTERYDFENCTWNASNNRFVEPDLNFEERWWTPNYTPVSHTKSVVDSVAYEGTRSLRLEVTNPAGGAPFQSLDLLQNGSRTQNKYCLATDYRVHFALLPEQFDPANSKFVFELVLSERPAGWPRLRYVLGSMDEEDVDAVPLTYVPGVWNAYDLDVQSDVRNLLSAFGADSIRAQDNSVYEVHAILSTRNSQKTVVFLDDLQYINDDSRAGYALLDWQEAADAYYKLQYPGVDYMVGTEISRFKAQPHMNAFVPGHFLVDYTGHVGTDSLYYAVDQVHAQGGLVSYNHPWGIGIYGDLSETPAHKAARILTMKRSLLRSRLFGCDILEVGYRWRMGIDLNGHLDLWDVLTANAVFETGVGVTDSHGSTPFYGWAPWQPIATYENNYITWLWATGISKVEFLRSLAAGKAYFGDPYRWQGEVEVSTTDGFPMGRVVLTDKPTENIVVRVTNVPATIDVRMKQGEIRENAPTEYTTVNWLRSESLAGTVVGGVFTDTVGVDMSLPSFVRFEIRDGSQEWAFTNPIAFVGQLPLDGVPSPRVAASLDALRIRGAEALTLRAASFDPVASQLSLALDETTPGLGRVEMDASAFGAPSSVTGAGSWAYDSGVLTLDGFTGLGSAATVSWGGPVDAGVASPGAPARLALSSGRPNPFGRGVVAELAMPDPGQALVEVLDVQGRRIRVLWDEWTPAGRHRVAWDGKDPYGRPVADGVYFLRLRALGSTLTTKSVKVH